LFVPGNRDSYVDPARASGADAIVFDLESAVPYGEKERARDIVGATLEKHGGEGPGLFVRISDARSDHQALDLDAVVVAGLGAVLLPQVVGVDDVRRLDDRLSELEAARGLPPGAILIDPLLETPQALYAAYDLAQCSPRIAYMGAGISRQGDIVRTLGYRWTRRGLETLYFRSKVLLEVRAAGVPFPLSGMWGDVADLDGLRELADQTRDIGYAGMMVIHPSHVPIVNEVFSPTAADIELWRATIAAMAEAERDGRGAIRLRGELIDEAHVKTAEQGLDQARRFGLVP
jgi:citrate lyase subunit beta/citryl-CoA lyase